MDRKYIKYLILPCFLGSLSSIVSIYFGFIIQSFMKAAINGSIYKSSIYHAFLWLLCVSILGVGYECVKALFLQKIRKDIKITNFKLIFNLSFQEFEKWNTSELMNNLDKNTNEFVNLLYGNTISTISDLFLAISAIFILCFIDIIFIPFIICIIIISLVPKLLEKRISILTKKVVTHQNKIIDKFGNLVNSLPLYLTNSIENDDISTIIDDLESSKCSQKQLNGILNVISLFINIGSTLCLVAITGHRITSSNIDISYIPLVSFLVSHVSSITFIITNYLNQKARASEIYNQLNINENIPNQIIVPSFDSLNMKNTYGYYQEDNKILYNISICKNNIYHIKGINGSGKSLLLKTILGEANCEGNIVINGFDINKNALESIYTQISYVTQKSYLFNTSIINNIILDYPLDIERLNNIIKVVNLTELIEKHGFHYTIVDNGKNISGGESQKINIARALYKPSSILFSDECCNNLDIKTKENIYDYFFTKFSTIVYIDHNYSYNNEIIINL